MVRRLVGVLTQVGLHQLEIADVQSFLKVYSQNIGQWTAPASGLFLEKVMYPGDLDPGKIKPAIPVYSHSGVAK
jgi:tRNA pseudouridine38-40 synthase